MEKCQKQSRDAISCSLPGSVSGVVTEGCGSLCRRREDLIAMWSGSEEKILLLKVS